MADPRDPSEETMQVDELRLSRNLAGVRKRQVHRRLRRARLTTLAGVLSLLGVLAAVGVIRGPAGPRHGPLHDLSRASRQLRFAAGAQTARTVALSDGSSLSLGAGAEMSVIDNSGERFRTLLDRGWARYEVRPGGPRLWVVEAGLFQVEVIGTAFTVARDRHGARIKVHRGRVLVRGPQVPGRLRQLVAGERLEVRVASRSSASDATPPGRSRHGPLPAGAKTQPSPKAPTPPPAPAPVGPVAHGTAVPPARRPATRPPPPEPVTHRPAIRPRAQLAPQPANTKPAAPPAAPPATPLATPAAAPAAGDLPRDGESPLARALQQADVLRAAGRMREAARVLQAALLEHPGGPGAALATLTLARLQLALPGEAPRAASSLRAALGLGLPPGLREQAMALLVRALHEGGEPATARQAAEAYRRAFPGGAWSAMVDTWSAGAGGAVEP